MKKSSLTILLLTISLLTISLFLATDQAQAQAQAQATDQVSCLLKGNAKGIAKVPCLLKGNAKGSAKVPCLLSTDQSIDQSTDQSTDQSIDQSIDEPFQLIVESVPADQPFTVGQVLLLTVKGAEDENIILKSLMVNDIDYVKIYKDHIIFHSTVPGPRAFMAQIPVPGEDPTSVVIFSYLGPSPSPSPSPSPGPVEEPEVFFLYQTEDNDENTYQAEIVASQEIRDLLKNPKFVDVEEIDQHGNPPPSTRAWTAYVKKENLQLPQVLITKKGKLLGAFEFPKSVDDTIILLKKYIKMP